LRGKNPKRKRQGPVKRGFGKAARPRSRVAKLREAGERHTSLQASI